MNTFTLIRTILGVIALGIITNVVSAELLQAAYSIAELIDRVAVRLLPAPHRERYEEEWASETERATRGTLQPLFKALGHLGCAPRMRRNLKIDGAKTGHLVVRVKRPLLSRPINYRIEVSLAMEKGGPKDTFLLGPGEKQTYRDLVAGTKGLVTVTRSNGRNVRYDNPFTGRHDGVVTICPPAKHRWRRTPKRSKVVVSLEGR